MPHRPDTAMILAAGLGTRMRPLTLDTPKPLIKARGKALMDYIIAPLIEAGVTRFVVNLHWLAKDVERHLDTWRENAPSEVKFIISDEREELLETGGGLAKARRLLGDKPIFVANTDAFWGAGDVTPVEAMVAAYDTEKMDILALLARTDRCLGYHGAGDFKLNEDGTLIRRGDAASAPFAFTGLRITKPQFYDDLPIKPFSANEVWNPVLAQKRMQGVVLDDFWLHIGDPTALEDAQMWLGCHGV